MIFSANTQELIEGLNVVTHAIPARAANKSMECVLMESFDNELSLTCTDGSVIIQTYVVMGSNFIPVPGAVGISEFLMYFGYSMLLNDEAYARDYAEQLIERKHFSRERAAFEMMKKGIDRELADEVLDEYEKDPCEQIQALLETKFARRLATEKDRLRTVNALKAMGFRWSDIRTCLEELE